MGFNNAYHGFKSSVIDNQVINDVQLNNESLF